jgi:hypothetical protein
VIVWFEQLIEMVVARVHARRRLRLGKFFVGQFGDVETAAHAAAQLLAACLWHQQGIQTRYPVVPFRFEKNPRISRSTNRFSMTASHTWSGVIRERLNLLASKYPPAKPGALCCEPLKAAIGVAEAPPMCGPPEGGSWIPDAASELRVQFRPRYLGTNAA